MLPYLGIKSGVVSGADQKKRSDLSMAELGLAELRKHSFMVKVLKKLLCISWRKRTSSFLSLSCDKGK